MSNIANVCKRDGRIAPFDQTRIQNAIFKAAQAVGSNLDEAWAVERTAEVASILEERFARSTQPPAVEEIQDIVEEVLIRSGQSRIAKAYILYREKRSQARQARLLLSDSMKLVDDYLEKLDWRVNENANMNYSLQGLNFYVASSVSARYWLNKIYPPEVQSGHVSGDFHIHDLGILSAYCCGWDLQRPAGARLWRRPGQGGKQAAQALCGPRSGRSSTFSIPSRANRPARRPLQL